MSIKDELLALVNQFNESIRIKKENKAQKEFEKILKNAENKLNVGTVQFLYMVQYHKKLNNFL